MPGLLFHGDVSAGVACGGRDGGLSGGLEEGTSRLFATASGEVSRINGLRVLDAVVDACRHDAGTHHRPTRRTDIINW